MISQEIQSALLSATGSHQGARVFAAPALLKTMTDLGLIGNHAGLTRQGTIVRDSIARDLEKAFD